MKAAVKKTETKRATAAKATEKKATVKKPAVKKAPAEKKSAVKKAPAEKKAAMPKTPDAKIVLQFGEKSIDQATLLRNVENYLAYDKDMPVSEQKGVEIYVKPEEDRAYIVVKGEEEGSILL